MERTKAEQEFALTGGVFDRLLKNKTGNIAGNLTKIFPKSQTPRGFPGGGGGEGWVVLELIGTLTAWKLISTSGIPRANKSIFPMKGVLLNRS